LAAAMLGPLIAPTSCFLELLVVIDAWSFNSLRLPDAVRRVIYAPGAASGEIALGEQSRPDLFWPVDILLGAGGNAVLSGRWRAFALGHHLRVGDHLVFRFKLGALQASVRIFTTGGVRCTYPGPQRSEEEILAR
jgi:CRISPR-associated Cas5-like protein